MDSKMQFWLNNEQKKIELQSYINDLTKKCWDRCNVRISNSLGSGELNCINNCVERFLDSSSFIARELPARAQALQNK